MAVSTAPGLLLINCSSLSALLIRIPLSFAITFPVLVDMVDLLCIGLVNGCYEGDASDEDQLGECFELNDLGVDLFSHLVFQVEDNEFSKVSAIAQKAAIVFAIDTALPADEIDEIDPAPKS